MAEKKPLDMLAIIGANPKQVSPQDEYRGQLRELAGVIREAIKSDDDDALADGLHEFVKACDAMPHVEGEHEDVSEGE